MLRCESLSPRRRIGASIAAWSFAALIVVGAIVDATILAPEPKPQQANVEIPAAVDPQPSLPPAAPANAAEAPAVITRSPRWHAASDARPNNRLDLDGATYTINHPEGDGLAIELRVADCARGELHANDARTPIVEGAVAGFFPDGTYRLSATCDRGRGDVSRTVDTVLHVQPARR